jgi:hypothetical protein
MRDEEGRMTYKRNMESYSGRVLNNPELRASVWLSVIKDMALASGPGEGSDDEGGEAAAAGDQGAEGDESAIPAIALPAAL